MCFQSRGHLGSRSTAGCNLRFQSLEPGKAPLRGPSLVSGAPCLAVAAQVVGRGLVVGVSQTLTVKQEPGWCASPPGPGTTPDPQLESCTHPWRGGQGQGTGPSAQRCPGLGLACSAPSSPHLAQVADAGPQKPLGFRPDFVMASLQDPSASLTRCP